MRSLLVPILVLAGAGGVGLGLASGGSQTAEAAVLSANGEPIIHLALKVRVGLFAWETLYEGNVQGVPNDPFSIAVRVLESPMAPEHEAVFLISNQPEEEGAKRFMKSTVTYFIRVNHVEIPESEVMRSARVRLDDEGDEQELHFHHRFKNIRYDFKVELSPPGAGGASDPLHTEVVFRMGQNLMALALH